MIILVTFPTPPSVSTTYHRKMSVFSPRHTVSTPPVEESGARGWSGVEALSTKRVVHRSSTVGRRFRQGRGMRTTPSSPADDFEWLLFEQDGVFTTAQVGPLMTHGRIRGHLARRRWRRLCRGVLLAGDGTLRREQQLWTAVLVAGHGAHLAGQTAVESAVLVAGHGAHLAGRTAVEREGGRDEPIHVVVPSNRGTSGRLRRLPSDMPIVHVHRTAVLPDHHREVASPPRTSIARAVVDGAAWAGSETEARDLIGDACREGRVTVAELLEVLEWFPTLHRRRLIATTIADIDGGAGALAEADLTKLCRRYRLPLPDVQSRRTDGAGRCRHLDARWRHGRLVVEVDGSHRVEGTSGNRIGAAGDRVLRVPSWLLRAQPAAVADRIRQALRDAEHATAR
jgi:very-short-patch-repair endonuclease